MNLSDYIKVYDNSLTPEQCQGFINLFEAEVDYQQQRDHGPYRFTEINAVEAKWNLDVLYAQIIKYKRQYWTECKICYEHVNPDHGWEQLRMKRYRPGTGEQFNVHTDSWGRDTAQRFLVYFWYLNDVEVGGETEFYGLDRPIKIKPRTGSLIMFPATWQYLHAGLQPTSNNKYIIGGYFHYG